MRSVWWKQLLQRAMICQRPWPATTERRRLGEWIVARGRQMGASIKTRKKDEPSPSRRELDDRCEMVMRDYIAVAADIEDLTACRERR